MSRRTYNSESRKAKALQTRSRILTAAKSLFEGEGFTAVTVDMIAEEASVSPSMIYTLFSSKHGVLREVIDQALDPKTYQALVDAAEKVQSPSELLKLSAKISRQMYDAECELMNTFREASAATSEFKELEKEREERRYKRQEKTLKRVFKTGSFKKELSLSDARDTLWTLTGRDLYRMLVLERGWSSNKYEKWLYHQLLDSLLT